MPLVSTVGLDSVGDDASTNSKNGIPRSGDREDDKPDAIGVHLMAKPSMVRRPGR